MRTRFCNGAVSSISLSGCAAAAAARCSRVPLRQRLVRELREADQLVGLEDVADLLPGDVHVFFLIFWITLVPKPRGTRSADRD